MSNSVVRFFVPGQPEPAGSKKSFVPLDKRLANDDWPRGMPYKDANGRVIVNTVDDNPKSKVWKQAVGLIAKQAFAGRELLDCPVAVGFRFCVARPKGHYGTGRNAGIVKNSAPTYPAVKPDALKLARAAEDAMTGVVWTDDARIVSEWIDKSYQEPVGLWVTVYSDPADIEWIRNRMDFGNCADSR